MFNSKNVRATGWLAAAAVLAFITGCQSDQKTAAANKPADTTNYGINFEPDVGKTEMQALLISEKANGARNDGTLYCDHFDAKALNSLGTTKLDLMLAGTQSNNPLIVYLDIPDDGTMQSRETAVDQYLKAKGLKADQISIQHGANPASNSPSAPNIKNYDKTDTAGDAAK